MVRSEEEKETAAQEQMAILMSTTNAMLSGYNQAQEAAMMVSAFSHVLAQDRDPTGDAEAPAWQWQATGLPYDMPSANSTSSHHHLFGGDMNYYHQGHVYHQGI